MERSLTLDALRSECQTFGIAEPTLELLWGVYLESQS
jgi:hypothetical protein